MHLEWNACVRLAHAPVSTVVISLPSMSSMVRNRSRPVTIIGYFATTSTWHRLPKHSVVTLKARSNKSVGSKVSYAPFLVENAQVFSAAKIVGVSSAPYAHHCRFAPFWNHSVAAHAGFASRANDPPGNRF